MIILYSLRKSSGLRALERWLNEQGVHTLRKRTRDWAPLINPKRDLVVCWGNPWPYPHQVLRILNAHAPAAGKLHELVLLQRAGVPCVEVSLAPVRGWYARRLRHQEANDLLANLQVGDYYVRPIECVTEMRHHVFQGKVIRTGLKTPRLPNPHPVFKSWNAGWALTYGKETVGEAWYNEAARRASKAAVKALGYDFGAVDVGVKADGSPVVFEVNSAPGLEGNTIKAYGVHILEVARA